MLLRFCFSGFWFNFHPSFSRLSVLCCLVSACFFFLRFLLLIFGIFLFWPVRVSSDILPIHPPNHQTTDRSIDRSFRPKRKEESVGERRKSEERSRSRRSSSRSRKEVGESEALEGGRTRRKRKTIQLSEDGESEGETEGRGKQL